MKKFLLLVFLAMAPRVWAQTADTILLNGKVLTVDPQFSIQEAIAIRDGKILARFDSDVEPDSAILTQAIEDALAAK